MSDRITSEKIAAAVNSAAQDVFSTMLQLPLNAEAYREEGTEPESVDGIVALVGIAGSWTGTGRIWCSPHFACKLAGALLMQEFEAVDEDVLDAVSEVANMIVGNVKTIFEEELGPLGLSVPTVIFGRNYRAHSPGVRTWTVIPFRSGEESWNLSFFMIPTKVHTPPAHRPEAVPVS